MPSSLLLAVNFGKKIIQAVQSGMLSDREKIRLEHLSANPAWLVAEDSLG